MFKVGKTPINRRLVLLNHKNNIYIRKTKLNYMQRIVPPPGRRTQMYIRRLEDVQDVLSIQVVYPGDGVFIVTNVDFSYEHPCRKSVLELLVVMLKKAYRGIQFQWKQNFTDGNFETKFARTLILKRILLTL